MYLTRSNARVQLSEAYLLFPLKHSFPPSSSFPSPSPSMSNQSLSQVYVDTQEAFEAWCASPHPTISKEHQALWSQARQRLIRLSDMVDRAALFSDNESLRDLSTSTVKFLLVPAWLGKVLMDQVGEGRKQGLLLGRAQHMRFLALCHQYNLLQDQDRHRQEAIESVAKDALQGIPHRPGQGPDAATRRALKIAQYSKEKTTKAAIQVPFPLPSLPCISCFPLQFFPDFLPFFIPS